MVVGFGRNQYGRFSLAGAYNPRTGQSVSQSVSQSMGLGERCEERGSRRAGLSYISMTHSHQRRDYAGTEAKWVFAICTSSLTSLG